MESEEASKIPPQVLVRAYRQLCQANNEVGMSVTLDRLMRVNLKTVKTLIRSIIPPEQDWFLEDDLIQDTWVQIMKILPTERGEMAEKAWVAFCRQRAIDAWRENFGREGTKLSVKIGDERIKITKVKNSSDSEPSEKEISEDNVDKLTFAKNKIKENSATPYYTWHIAVREDQCSLIKKIVKETINKIQEPLLKLIAIDHFGDNPSPISSGTSENGKPPLTEQTKLSRHQIARKIETIKKTLAGNILSNKELDIDANWLKKFISK